MTGAHVYVVVGSVGEYSDRREWFVAAYADEDAAKQHIVLAHGRARELEADLQIALAEGKSSWDWWQSVSNQYDTSMQTDYQEAATYYHAAVPLLDAVPEVA